jgi:hypothetical protein
MQPSMLFLAKSISSQLRSSSFLMFFEALWVAPIGLRAMVPSTCVKPNVSWLADELASLVASEQPRLVK